MLLILLHIFATDKPQLSRNFKRQWLSAADLHYLCNAFETHLKIAQGQHLHKDKKQLL